MKFKLQRFPSAYGGTFGTLSQTNQLFLFTLEPITPVIPKGTYTCKRRYSPKFKTIVYEVINVPGHTDIEFHIGNSIEDTHGCILLGEVLDLTNHKVTSSAIAFKKFMLLLKDEATFTLEIMEKTG